MIKVTIIAAGKMKQGPHLDLVKEYKKRIVWPLEIIEIDIRGNPPDKNRQENRKIAEKIPEGAHIVALDSQGTSLSSAGLARISGPVFPEDRKSVSFLIGGSDGLSPELRKQAHFVLSFGAQTWPHMLARVMLMEQIYRAQQIINGHPYHRE